MHVAMVKIKYNFIAYNLKNVHVKITLKYVNIKKEICLLPKDIITILFTFYFRKLGQDFCIQISTSSSLPKKS